MPSTISPASLKEQLGASGSRLIDVRTPVEYESLHVRGAQNVPLDKLDPASFKDCGETLYVICQRGSRGQTACQKLHSAGITNAVNVEGGTLACESAGLDMVRGKQVMSLERQVRIAAGALVLVGTVLGALVSPYWLGLSGFVGAGLVFAGLTDTCGMGMMLAQMPWNQVKSCST